MRRRTFLKLAGIGGVATGASLLGSRLVSAVDPPTWGALPPGVWPGAAPHYKVLEIFLYGGLSPWETFYHRATAPTGSNLAAFAGFDESLSGTTGVERIRDMIWSFCGGAPSPAVETHTFANDALGQPVSLGPFTKPLWSNHILQRMRIVVLQHNLLPHEAAIPYALTGMTLGRPQLAGMGATLQRQALAQSPRTLPYSYVCAPMSFRFPSDNLQATTAVGMHQASARPLTIRIGVGTDSLRDMLQQRVGVAGSTDGLIRQYRSQYRDNFRWRGSGAPTRSKAFAEYNAGLEALFSAPLLRNLLSSAPLTLQSDPPCLGTSPSTPLGNMPGTAIRLAAYLLTRTSGQEARYACVVDNGLDEVASGGGYDTHSNGHLYYTGVNLWNTLSTLADVIRNPSVPRTGDADRISLDDTLVLLTTEFGRTPYRSFGSSPSSNSNGRDHWTQGYVNVLIGGPIQSGRFGIAGAIHDDGRADATRHFTPTDLRAAALMAAGLDPFTPDVLGVSDVSAAVSPTGDIPSRLIGLRERILNVT
jgi:hypothetical protein